MKPHTITHGFFFLGGVKRYAVQATYFALRHTHTHIKYTLINTNELKGFK